MSKTEKVVAIVQARLTSTRLPKKIMLDLCGKPLLWHIVERVRQAKLIDSIVLAIPDSSINNDLEALARKYGWNIFRGDENDVLSRYYHAAKENAANVIVRITSDCPLADPKIIDETIRQHIRDGNDYTAVGIEGGFPRGLDVEVFDFAVLEIAHGKAVKTYEREHVTPFMYQNPNLFKIRFIEATGKVRRPDIRLTVDTEEDLLLIREIFSILYCYRKTFSIEDVLAVMDDHPRLQSINAHIVQKDIPSS